MTKENLNEEAREAIAKAELLTLALKSPSLSKSLHTELEQARKVIQATTTDEQRAMIEAHLAHMPTLI